MTNPNDHPNGKKTPFDVAADLLVFAPVGLAIELGKHLPDLAKAGRSHFEGPLDTARFVGNFAAMQGRQQFAEKFRQAAEPFFGSTTQSSTMTGPAAATDTTMTHGSVDDLPIAGYETLSASQILTHLEGLGDEELKSIRTFEIVNRSRKSVLSRIDQLLETA